MGATIWWRYMSGGVRGLLSQWRNGARYYYHFDGLGSVMQVTDGSQNVVARYKYDAWGNDLVDLQSPLPNPFKYVGGLGYYSDKESGLKLLGVRYYDSQIGRFWSLDPIKDGWNWYGYVKNNPVNKMDPLGLQLQPSDDWSEVCERYHDCMRLPTQIFAECTRRIFGYGFVSDLIACMIGCAVGSVIVGELTTPACATGCAIVVGIATVIAFLRWRTQCAAPYKRAHRRCYELYPCPTALRPR